MKVQSTLYYGDNPIADVTWELDDRARTAQQTLAALSIEDSLRSSLRIEHKIIKDKTKLEIKDVPEDRSNVETSQSPYQSVQGDEDREYYGMDDWADVDEDRG